MSQQGVISETRNVFLLVELFIRNHFFNRYWTGFYWVLHDSFELNSMDHIKLGAFRAYLNITYIHLTGKDYIKMNEWLEKAEDKQYSFK